MFWVENGVVGFYRILVHLTMTTSHHIDGDKIWSVFWWGLKMVLGFGSTKLSYISTVSTSLHILVSIGLWWGLKMVELGSTEFWYITMSTTHHFDWPKK